MAYLGKRSLLNLSEARWHLQKVTQRAITKVDFSIIDCERSEAEQIRYFNAGLSKAIWGSSGHNYSPAYALDFIPCPLLDWNDRVPFKAVKDAFSESVIELKSEGELPVDFDLTFGYDFKTLSDDGHIEIKNWRRYAKR